MNKIILTSTGSSYNTHKSWSFDWSIKLATIERENEGRTNKSFGKSKLNKYGRAKAMSKQETTWRIEILS